MGILSDWQILDEIKIVPTPEYPKKRPGVHSSYGLSSYGLDARVGSVFKVFSPVQCREIDIADFDENALVTVDLTPQAHEWVSNDDGDMEARSTWTCTKCNQSCWDVERFMNGCVKVDDYLLLPPHSFALAETVEYFEIPRDVLAVVVGKSTYARCGIVVNVTPLEPEWKGKVTVEISNTTSLPARIYVGQGIMQILFFRADGCIRENIENLRTWFINKFKYAWSVADEDELNQALHQKACKVSYADRKGKYQDQKGLEPPKSSSEADRRGDES